ncbi:MAG: lipopolysaccharide heptosyltransferase I [Gammaproteobacteria bacterium]|nr:lipopolysaccharide heptosyltransferase I [Gammaproteobacteria bacterium]
MPRILIIKTSSLGDVVHNLPIVTDLVAHVPGAQIDWVVEEGFTDIPALHPGVTRVIPVAVRRWRRRLWAPSTWREIGTLRKTLRTVRYDAVLDTQGLLKSAIIARLAGAPISGQNAATVRERNAARFYQRTYNVARGRHAVVRNRDLAAQAFGYALPTPPPDYGLRVPAEAALAGTLPARYAVCLHATSRDSKRWPDADWVALGHALMRQGLTPFFPWGGAHEQARARRLAEQVAGAVVAPRLRLRELATVLDRAAAVVGVDTGLVHLAAALGRPTVALYIDSSPHLTGLLPTNPASVVSLGGQGAPPNLNDVTRALAQLGVLS